MIQMHTWFHWTMNIRRCQLGKNKQSSILLDMPNPEVNTPSYQSHVKHMEMLTDQVNLKPTPDLDHPLEETQAT